MAAIALIATIPWAVGAARGLYRWARAKVKGRAAELESLEREERARDPLNAQIVAALDAEALQTLQARGVAPMAPIAIDAATVQQAAASFRSVTPGIPNGVLRLLLAYTHLDSTFGQLGAGCWNMATGQPGDDTFKCFSSQQAAAAGYLRLLASDRYAAAYEAAQGGDVLGFVEGLFNGGWYERRGPEIRWGLELAAVLARLPAIDAALAAGLAQETSAATRVAGIGAPLAVAAAAAAGAAAAAWRDSRSGAGLSSGASSDFSSDAPEQLGGAGDDPIVGPAFPWLAQWTPEDRQALLQAQLAVGLDPTIGGLLAVIDHESAGKPAALNPLPAAGIIQLTRGANLPGFTTADAIRDVAAWSPAQQLQAVVTPYYQRMFPNGAPPGVAGQGGVRLLRLNFLPALAGQADDYVLGVSPDATGPGGETSDDRIAGVLTRGAIYSSNPGFDGGRRGYFTWADVDAQAARGVARGAQAGLMTVSGATMPRDGSTARVSGISPALAAALGVGALGAGYGAWRLLKGAEPPAAGAGPAAAVVRPAAAAALPVASSAPASAFSAGRAALPLVRPSPVAAPRAPARSSMATPAAAAPSMPKAHGGGGGRAARAPGRVRPSAAPAAAPSGTPGGTWTPQQRADDEAAWNQATADANAAAAPSGTPGGTWTPQQRADDEAAWNKATADANAETLDQGDNTMLPEGFNPPPGTSATRGLEDPEQGDHVDDATAPITDSASEPETSEGEGETAPLEDAVAGVRGVSRKARVAGVDPGRRSMAGLMLEAVRAGQEYNGDSFVEVEVPSLDLVITVPRRSLRARVDGYAQPLLLGVSYNDQVEICRIMGWISLTKEMVDAVWRDANTWRIQPVGQWVPGADIGSLAFAARHTKAVDEAIAALDNGNGPGPDAVVRPEGKAWILHERLPTSAGAVLWGWQQLDGTPLQGFGFKHNAAWVDYSMCEAPALRTARVLSTDEAIDLLDWYRQHFSDPAMQPFLDAYEA